MHVRATRRVLGILAVMLVACAGPDGASVGSGAGAGAPGQAAPTRKPQTGIGGLIDGADTPDPHTIVFHWRRTSYQGGEMGESQMEVLPRHVLEAALLADKENFSNNPYFVVPESFVGSGPYRPMSW